MRLQAHRNGFVTQTVRNLAMATKVAVSSAAITLGLVAATTGAASAQAAYGSYVGIGGSFGLTSGSSAAGEGSSSGAVIAFRYRLLEVPLSLRAQALIAERTALVPTVSYDFPLNWQTDLYIGAGLSIPFGGSGSNTSPVGNKTSFVLQPGIDHSVPNSNIVIFGNAILAVDGYETGGGAAASVQGGVGLRF